MRQDCLVLVAPGSLVQPTPKGQSHIPKEYYNRLAFHTQQMEGLIIMTIRAVISARYSSDKQHDTSIEAQLSACRAYAQRKGYTIINEYIDRAESGRFDDRPAYQQMLTDAKKHLFDVVIFHKIDRNARNEYDYYFHKEQLKRNKIRIEYAEQSFDNTPEGQMMENMIVGMSAYYSRNLARETMKVLTLKANRAEFNGGTPPFGYSVQDKKYVINGQEALAVKTIFEMFLQGAGYGTISDWLTAHGYKTRRGRYFGKNSLHDLLKNEKYIGVYVYGKMQRDFDGRRTIQANTDNEKLIRRENALPAIIDDEIFRRVQDIMGKRKNSGRQCHEGTTTYLLTGLVTCAYCGSKMIETKVKNGQYYYYRCNKKERHADAGKCPTPMIPKDELENLILDEIYERLLNPKALPILIKDINDQVNRQCEKNHKLIDQLHAEEKSLKKNLDRLYQNMYNDTFDEFDKEEMQQTKERIRAVREQLVSTCIQTETISIPESMVREVIQDWSLAIKEKDPDRVQAMLQNVVSSVVVNPDYSVVTQLKIVCLELVPRTGIEPVRVFLPAGF